MMEKIKSWLLGTSVVVFVLTLLSAFLAASAFAAADTYPTKPVRLVIPFAAGGGADVVGRLIAAKLSDRLGKQVVVENRVGAGGVIGTEMVAKSAPDGYTLLFIPASFTMQPALQKLPYDPVKSFSPVARVGKGAYVFVINPSVPANSLKEFIALAKQQPGHFAFGAAGVGSTAHMFIELFEMMADIDLKIVQFKGGNQQVIDLLGGHSHGTMISLPPVMPQIVAGKLRGLATTGSKRSVFLPDLPTVAEAGVPGYEAIVWWGILAPAGTPEPIVDKLNQEIKAILAMDEVNKLLSKEGAEADYVGAAEFGPFIEGEIANWTRVVKKADIKIE